MKYIIVSAVILCLILTYPPIIKAEVILEPQTSTSASESIEPQTSTPAAAGAESPSTSPAGTSKQKTNYQIQGVQEYKMPQKSEAAEQPIAETASKAQNAETTKVDTSEEKPFDVEEYINKTKMNLQEFDIMYDIVDKLKNEDGTWDMYTPDRWFDTINGLMDDLGPQRSVMSIATRPGGNMFGSVRFACSGDYQMNGVYFVERDLNSNNGSKVTSEDWDGYKEAYQRPMTDYKEGFWYHDLTLNPRLEFAHGMITLHTQFKHGGYIWEMAFPNYRYESQYIWGSHGQSTDLDTSQLKMTGLFLEAVTPLGVFVAGKLPEDPTMGITGIGWGCPLPPMLGFLGAFGLFYGKAMEGMFWDDDRKAWEGHGWDYLEVQNGDGYKDEDDISIYAAVAGGTMNAPIIGGRLYGGGAYALIKGGEESSVFNETELSLVAGAGRYTRGTLRAHGIIATLGGTMVDLNDEERYFGKLFSQMEDLYIKAMDAMDKSGAKYRTYDLFEKMPKRMKVDPVLLLAGNAYFDWGPLTPEGCIIYAEGAEEPWQIPMVVPGFLFQKVGNKSPQGMLKSYLLNEVERKYFALVGNPAMALVDTTFPFIDIFSTNITAVKAGSTLRLGEHFSVYGQAISAWRSNVEYYKKNYWDYFILTKALRDMEWYYDDSGMRQMRMDAILQLKSEDYHEDEIDNYLGLELSGKFTVHVRSGLDISLIGAYFKPGGFYEDILTPKRYSSIKALVSDVAGTVGIDDQDEKIIYGPYEACRFFDLTDTYSVQLRFELKWDS